jgi:hypothetical protein
MSGTYIMFVKPLVLTAPNAFFVDVSPEIAFPVNGGSLFGKLKGLYTKGKRAFNSAKKVVEANPLLKTVVDTGINVAKSNPLYTTAKNAYNIGDAFLGSKTSVKQVAKPYIAQAQPYIAQAQPYVAQAQQFGGMTPEQMYQMLQSRTHPFSTKQHGYGMKKKKTRSKKKVLSNSQIRKMLMN